MSFEEKFGDFIWDRVDELLMELQKNNKEYQRDSDKICEIDKVLKNNLSSEMYLKVIESEEVNRGKENLMMEHCYLRGFSDALRIAIKL